MSLRLPRNTRTAERKTIARRVANMNLLKQEERSHVSNSIIIIIIVIIIIHFFITSVVHQHPYCQLQIAK
jgi:hypothetical protein